MGPSLIRQPIEYILTTMTTTPLAPQNDAGPPRRNSRNWRNWRHWRHSAAIPSIAPTIPRKRTGRTARIPHQSRDQGTAPAPRLLTLEVITDSSQFAQLEEEWNALFERAGRSHQFFQSFNWLWHWAQVYMPAQGKSRAAHPTTQLAIVTGRIEGRLVMIWPLVRERRHGLIRLAWMGTPVSQYGDVLIDEHPDTGEWLRTGWAFVRERLGADLLSLEKVRADAALARLLEQHSADLVERRQAASLKLGNYADFESFERHGGKRARSGRRRKRRRLAERGEIAFAVLGEGPEAAGSMPRVLATKRRWLEAKGLISRAFLDDRFDRFFLSVAGAKERPVGLQLSELRVGGKAVAYEIGFCAKGRHIGHILTFDMDYARYSPGLLQTEEIVRRAFALGLEVFDLMAPADAYKLSWTDTLTDVCDYEIPLSWRGRLYRLVWRRGLYRAAKWFMSKGPQGLRRLLARSILRKNKRR